MDRAPRTRERQRERLLAAEAATFAHDGIEATSAPLVLDASRLTTRVVRIGSGPPTVAVPRRGHDLDGVGTAPVIALPKARLPVPMAVTSTWLS